MRPPKNHHSSNKKHNGRSGSEHFSKHRLARAERNSGGKSELYWLSSEHAAIAALKNKNRNIVEAYCTTSKEPLIDELCRARGLRLEIKSSQEITALCGRDAVHQDIALKVHRLPDADIMSMCNSPGPIVILDQVTDPRNIGAIMRSTAAFNGAGLIISSHKAPDENAAMARVAAGALDTVPFSVGGNLVQIIQKLQKAGRWCVGLDTSGTPLHASNLKDQKIAVILGSESDGIRRLTREACDEICSLSMSDNMESLNVSIAAAITLYELFPKK